MSTADLALIKATVANSRTLACPICDHTLDVPPVPVSDHVGAAFGMSGTTLAMVHGEQILKRAVAELRTHLRTHSVDEWVHTLHTTSNGARP